MLWMRPTPENKIPSNPTSVSFSNSVSDLNSLSTAPTSPTHEFDPEMLKNMHIDSTDQCDSEMLGLYFLIDASLAIQLPCHRLGNSNPLRQSAAGHSTILHSVSR